MRLAIIGTAGRQDDGPRMSAALYRVMLADALRRVREFEDKLGDAVTMLVSGGAAWADHLAISLFTGGEVPALELYFPCDWNDKIPEFASRQFRDPGSTANYYHRLFGEKWLDDGKASLRHISQAIAKGAKVAVNPKGFLARNLQVATRAQGILAYTWGSGKVPKDGGTSHTWGHSKAKTKIHVPLGSLL